MELFLKTVNLARNSTGTSYQAIPASTDGMSSENQPTNIFAKNHRKLLDVAWKIYDMTSEMHNLKDDVNNLNRKIDEIEANTSRRKENTNTSSESTAALIVEENEGNNDDKRKEDFSCTTYEKYLSSQINRPIDARSRSHDVNMDAILYNMKDEEKSISLNEKQSKLRDMDDLSFSIFKEVANDVTEKYIRDNLNRYGCKVFDDYDDDDDLSMRPRRDEMSVARRFLTQTKSDQTNKRLFDKTRKTSQNSNKTDSLSDLYNHDDDFSNLNDSLYYHHSRYLPRHTQPKTRSEAHSAVSMPLFEAEQNTFSSMMYLPSRPII